MQKISEQPKAVRTAKVILLAGACALGLGLFTNASAPVPTNDEIQNIFLAALDAKAYANLSFKSTNMAAKEAYAGAARNKLGMLLQYKALLAARGVHLGTSNVATCQIAQDSCTSHPQYAGLFEDPNGINASRCLALAASYRALCASPMTTAIFVQGSHVAAIKSVGTSCMVLQPTCIAHPEYVGFFKDTIAAANVNQATCLGRAAAYATWCKNPTNVTTKVGYCTNGNCTVLKSAKGSVAPPKPATTPVTNPVLVPSTGGQQTQ